MTVKIHPSVQALEDEIIETRRDIHKHPELSFPRVSHRSTGVR